MISGYRCRWQCTSCSAVVLFLILKAFPFLSIHLQLYTITRTQPLSSSLTRQLTKTNASTFLGERELSIVFVSFSFLSHSVLDLCLYLFIISVKWGVWFCHLGGIKFGDVCVIWLHCVKIHLGLFGFSLICLFAAETGRKYWFFEVVFVCI